MEKKDKENIVKVVADLVFAFDKTIEKTPITAGDFLFAVTSFIVFVMEGYGIPEEKRNTYIDLLREILEHEKKS